MSPSRKNKEYYAIFKGRVEEPTIFSSWGHAHPRITGYKKPISKSFTTLQAARRYMTEKGVTEPREIIKSEDEDTTPVCGNGFYAVANGDNPGVYPLYRGKYGAEKEVDKVEGSCHKRFKTEAQAKEFIDEWKETFAGIWSEIIREALDEGLRPRSIDAFRPHEMRQTVVSFLHMPGTSTDIDELVKETERASLQDETPKT
ncbi:uncharacterized protein N7503_003221 [Penicillium pulvis]|uniref:uncharacterized protein n=1 Tax=Penicillium pulvis TaxID=1562058 RepID=UPI002548392D|nr:uncharacterized protein N7503_003221 [Penicillium pulvis]KAJ5805619.1 hypothetical protein N7503_003221 [Penicillium pulvis]